MEHTSSTVGSNSIRQKAAVRSSFYPPMSNLDGFHQDSPHHDEHEDEDDQGTQTELVELEDWYYVTPGDGERHGPVSGTVLLQLKASIEYMASQGIEDEKEAAELASSAPLFFVWRDGMTKWVPVDEVESILRKHGESKLVQAKKRGSRGKKKKRAKCSIYITGLPDDVTVDELQMHFKNAGIMQEDLDTMQPLIKIYTDDAANPKGDATIHFVHELSAQRAIEFYDDSLLRPTVRIKVKLAVFNEDKIASNDVTKKAKRRLLPQEIAVRRRLKLQRLNELLGWEDDPARVSSGLRIVILKHMFTPEQAAEGNPENFYAELEKEVGLECQRIGGTIEKLTVFRDSPVGAIAVKFASSQGAEACKEALHGRWFDQRRIECEYFDGITNYKIIHDSEDDEQKRLEEFGKWIESSL